MKKRQNSLAIRVGLERVMCPKETGWLGGLGVRLPERERRRDQNLVAFSEGPAAMTFSVQA